MPSGIYKRTTQGFQKGNKINKGRKHPNRKKPSIFTEEHIKNIRDAAIKRYQDTKERLKTSEATKRGWTLEMRKEKSEAMKGEKHPNWIVDRSFLIYPDEFSEDLKTFIRKRDKFTCQICGKNGFTVHHIDYDKQNCDPENLITLCRKCHLRTNFNREYWSKYFQTNIKNNTKLWLTKINYLSSLEK